MEKRKLWRVALVWGDGSRTYPDKNDPRNSLFNVEPGPGLDLPAACRVAEQWVRSQIGSRVKVEVEAVDPTPEPGKPCLVRLRRDWHPDQYWRSNGTLTMDPERGTLLPSGHAETIAAALRVVQKDCVIEVTQPKTSQVE